MPLSEEEIRDIGREAGEEQCELCPCLEDTFEVLTLRRIRKELLKIRAAYGTDVSKAIDEMRTLELHAVNDAARDCKMPAVEIRNLIDNLVD